MTFKPYHYAYIDDFLRYYASSLGYTDVIRILDNGIATEQDAKVFCDFIPVVLDQRLADEESGKIAPLGNGSAIISDLHYEAGSFVCDAGYEPIWEAMLEEL
ncbi:hypothetical protein ACSV5M_12915 [Cellvibrio sp. ARAG 10.3]|uniref:hypothetical protein n=1 Tax=Cellvibrio sp. ARAG 10.3 TaxID=3451358 RepID=UPI003F446ADC